VTSWGDMNEQIRSDLDIMARTICGEVRGEGKDTDNPIDDWEAMIFVAGVIVERAKRGGWWGNTIKEVCLARAQFSCWNEGDPNRAVIEALTITDPVLREAYMAAYSVAVGLVDYMQVTNGATSYYAKSMPDPPWWAKSMQQVAEVGNHIGMIQTA